MANFVLHETITIRRSAEDCMRYLRDFSTIEQWDPGVLRSEKITPGPVKEGTRFSVMLKLPSGASPMEYVVENLDQRRLVLRGSGQQFTVLDTIEVAEHVDGASIDYRAEMNLPRVIGGMKPLLAPWLGRVGKKAVRGLGHALEDPVPPTSPAVTDIVADRLIAPGMLKFTRRGYFAMRHKGLNQYMDGKTVVITGPTAGLGFAAACELARMGARLILVGRGESRLTEAKQQIVGFAACDGAQLEIETGDLSLIADVRDIASRILAHTPKIDVLINNAGALFNERSETAEGVESSLAINLYAPTLLTKLLRPALDGGRVINVASGGMYLQPLVTHDFGYLKEKYDGAKAYARAKRALVCLTKHWAKTDPAVQFQVMHPGWAATPGVEKALPAFNLKMQKQLRDSRMGADTMVWLASTNSLTPEHNGLFWLDRRPHVTAILPRTEVTQKQQRELLEHISCELGV